MGQIIWLVVYAVCQMLVALSLMAAAVVDAHEGRDEDQEG